MQSRRPIQDPNGGPGGEDRPAGARERSAEEMPQRRWVSRICARVDLLPCFCGPASQSSLGPPAVTLVNLYAAANQNQMLFSSLFFFLAASSAWPRNLRKYSVLRGSSFLHRSPQTALGPSILNCSADFYFSFLKDIKVLIFEGSLTSICSNNKTPACAHATHTQCQSFHAFVSV